MPLKKAVGNTYEFVTHTWNTVKGKCPYECSYCYVRRICKRFDKEQRGPYLDERELRSRLGEGNTIFVCDSIDLFAPDIPASWIYDVRDQAGIYFRNTYLWHTKNPARAVELLIPKSNYILCVTVESDIWCYGNAPDPVERLVGLSRWEGRRMVTIEPIMDFNRAFFADEIIACHPEQVNIGADIGHNGLSEPSAYNIAALIERLAGHTKVHLKKNLRRLLPESKFYDVSNA